LCRLHLWHSHGSGYRQSAGTQDPTCQKNIRFTATSWHCSTQRREAGIEPGDGPLTVGLVFYLPMPASWSKRKRAAMLHSPHCQKPDLDNLAKAVLDGLQPIIGDDCRVWQFGVLRKLWAEHGGIGITIEEMSV